MAIDKNSFTILLQYESCDINFHQFTINYGFMSNIYDDIIVSSKVILSEYKPIKVNDLITVNFKIEPYLLNDKSRPEAFGDFSKNNNCIIYVPPTFADRLNFILNRNIKPYFDLGCIKEEKYRKPTVKTFSMQSKVNLDDYRN